MPAKDKYHDAVKAALIKDGWTITFDPFTLAFGTHEVFIDLGAERIIAAEKGAEKIAVEIKTFASRSAIADLEQAVGQYMVYRAVLRRSKPEYRLFIAVPRRTASTLFLEPLPLVTLQDAEAAIIVFDPAQEEIIEWRPH